MFFKGCTEQMNDNAEMSVINSVENHVEKFGETKSGTFDFALLRLLGL